MRYDPIDDESRGDNYANAWQEQRENAAEIGMEVADNRHGKLLNPEE